MLSIAMSLSKGDWYLYTAPIKGESRIVVPAPAESFTCWYYITSFLVLVISFAGFRTQRLFWLTLGAGAASKSASEEYESSVLSHKLPCRKNLGWRDHPPYRAVPSAQLSLSLVLRDLANPERHVDHCHYRHRYHKSETIKFGASGRIWTDIVLITNERLSRLSYRGESLSRNIKTRQYKP